ncbi:MAG: HPP family protein [Opitutales bacterium]|nr:HPP family protein [Opitutales bacterium]
MFQVGLATVTLFIALWFEHFLIGAEAVGALLIGAIASSAFILFVSPHRPAAMSRRVLGGHGWALVVGSLVSLLTHSHLPVGWQVSSPWLFSLYAAVTVGLCVLAMTITNTEHAPGAGTALAFAGHGFDWALITFIASSVVILVVIHRLLRRHLKDLYQ